MYNGVYKQGNTEENRIKEQGHTYALCLSLSLSLSLTQGSPRLRRTATSPPASATQAAQLADPTSPRLGLLFLFLFLID